MDKERILITVKTYPTLSRKYGETVCTAGVREDGSWVRLYPVPFRRLNEKQQYRKFDWLEFHTSRNSSDPRPETYRPVDFKQLIPVGHLDTKNNWQDRRNILLKKAAVYTRMQELIDGAKANRLSLAVFKPTKILGFSWEEEEDREWDTAKLAEMRKQASQGVLFEEDAWRATFKVIPKLPYGFSYRFEDADGHKSKMRILDWEIGALFWKCVRDHGTEKVALEKVREKYVDAFRKTDLHFFLGTTQQYHLRAPNPWMIIGVFPIPNENQLDLF